MSTILRVKRKRGEAPVASLVVRAEADATQLAGVAPKRKKVEELAAALDAVVVSPGGEGVESQGEAPTAGVAAAAGSASGGGAAGSGGVTHGGVAHGGGGGGTKCTLFRRVDTVGSAAGLEEAVTLARRGAKRKAVEQAEAGHSGGSAAAGGGSATRPHVLRQVRARRVKGAPGAAPAAVYDLEVDDIKSREEAKVEEDILHNYLPMVREYVGAAADASQRDEEDEYVYDVYCVAAAAGGGMGGAAMDLGEAAVTLELLPEDEWADEYSSEYDTEDSNAENHPDNDYPDEEEDTSDDGDGGGRMERVARSFGGRLGGGDDDTDFGADDYGADDSVLYAGDNEEYDEFAYESD